MSPADAPAAPHPRCPTCGHPVTWPGNAARPFCSVRCKLIDLGGWLDETYRMPGGPLGREPMLRDGVGNEPGESI